MLHHLNIYSAKFILKMKNIRMTGSLSQVYLKDEEYLHDWFTVPFQLSLYRIMYNLQNDTEIAFDFYSKTHPCHLGKAIYVHCISHLFWHIPVSKHNF